MTRPPPAGKLRPCAHQTRILILGGGFGGAYCANGPSPSKLRWKPDLQGEVEVVLMDRNNYFIFYPLLVEAGVGSIQPDPHRRRPAQASADDARFVQATVKDINLDDNRVSYQVVGPKRLPRDDLRPPGAWRWAASPSSRRCRDSRSTATR